MPKPLYIDRKGLRHHGDIQEEYLNNLNRNELELNQVLNYADDTGTNEYNFIVTGITDDVIYLEAIPLSVSINKDEEKLKECNIVKNYLDEYNKK
mgnify:CR=1 FL=1